MKKFRGLGVGRIKGRVLLFAAFEKENFFRIAASKNGVDFQEFKNWGEVIKEKGGQEEIKNCANFCLSKIEDSYFLTYNFKKKNTWVLCGARWSGFSHWQKIGEIIKTPYPGILIPEYYFKNKYLLLFAEQGLQVAYSSDLFHWRVYRRPIFTPPKGRKLRLGGIFLEEKIIWIAYYLLFPKQISLEVIGLSSANPWQIVKKTETPVLIKKGLLSPLGVIFWKGKVFAYWQKGKNQILVDNFDYSLAFPLLFLKKFPANPILFPRQKKGWEAKAVFNSAVVKLGGKIHFLYRAVGREGVSVFGYASSKDGFGVEERSFNPVFNHFWFFEKSQKAAPLVFYSSGGGGQGGSEDPRITKLEDKLYVTYTAFDGVTWPRIGFTSIKTGDFLKKRWRWQKPVLISPPGEMHKNWVIFPEKIKGKYAILHSISPQIGIDYRDSLDFDGKTFIRSYYHGKSPDALWEKVVKGTGPPPIKTPLGWLILYHGLDTDFWQYKMGAMILDKANPEKILFRARRPILEPTEVYENQGLKPGIVYSCGATVAGGKLLVYYGGADTVLCLATAPLEEFLGKLKSGGEPRLVPWQKPVGLPYD